MLRRLISLTITGTLFVCLSGAAGQPGSARGFASADARFSAATPMISTDAEAQAAAKAFILAVSSADAQAVWEFASEEEQEAFATQPAVYAAYATAFPGMTQAARVEVGAVWAEGDTSFVELTLLDSTGQHHRASIGLWLNDAGDWKVVSCEVSSAQTLFAAL